MTTNNYSVVRTAEGSMTTYRVVGMDVADNAAICHALIEAAREAWQYVTTAPGTYTAAQLGSGKQPISLREDTELPTELTEVSVECGTFRCCIGLKDWNGRDNYSRLFRCLDAFEKLSRVKQNERAVFTARMELGKLLCEACVVLPTNVKAICDLCGDDPLRPALAYPALDLDRRCIVATDARMMVAKKVAVASIHYEDKVPETFCLPKEVARMQGEVTVQLFERGCAVIDQNGVIAEVEHTARYPKWHSVWPKYRGGMTLVDSKTMAKAVKCAANGLPERCKGKAESLLLTHYPASANLRVCGYDGAVMVNSQTLPDCVATDELAWRLPVNAWRFSKVLALKPKTMWAGYAENSTLPYLLVLEDMEAGMAATVMHCYVEDLQDALRETEQEFAVASTRDLYQCFSDDGWLLEQMETKYPTCGQKGAEQPTEQEPSKVCQPVLPAESPATVEPSAPAPAATPLSLADRLRAALRQRLAA